MSTQPQPSYDFLSHPPVEKKRLGKFTALFTPSRQPPTPIGASHAHGPSQKNQAIETWSSKVHPGSPSTSPITPSSGAVRRFSLTSSIRRVSSGRPRAASGSGALANLIQTPGTGTVDMNPTTADFVAQGYSSFFVTLPSSTSGPKSAVVVPPRSKKPTLAGRAPEVTARRRRSASVPQPPALLIQPSLPSEIQLQRQITPESKPKVHLDTQLKTEKTKPPRTPISPSTFLRRKKNRYAGLPTNVNNSLTVMQLMEEIGEIEAERRPSHASSMTTMVFEPVEPMSSRPSTADSRPSTDSSGGRRLDRLRPAPLNLDQPKRRLRGVDAVAVNDALPVVAHTVKPYVDELGTMVNSKKSLSNLRVLFRGRK